MKFIIVSLLSLLSFPLFANQLLSQERLEAIAPALLEDYSQIKQQFNKEQKGQLKTSLEQFLQLNTGTDCSKDKSKKFTPEVQAQAKKIRELYKKDKKSGTKEFISYVQTKSKDKTCWTM